MHIPHGRVILAVRQDSTESKCEYTMTDDHEALFHRAFKDLSEKYKYSQSSSGDEGNVLFSYGQYEGVVEDDDGYLELESHSVPLPPEMNISSYTTIYSHLLSSVGTRTR